MKTNLFVWSITERVTYLKCFDVSTFNLLIFCFLISSGTALNAQSCQFFNFLLETSGFDCDSNEGEICFVTTQAYAFPVDDCNDYVLELEFPTPAFSISNFDSDQDNLPYTIFSSNATTTILRYEPDLLVSKAFTYGCLTGVLSTPSTVFIMRIINPNPPNDVVSSLSFTLDGAAVIGTPGTTTSLSDWITPNGPLLSEADALQNGQRVIVNGVIEVDVDSYTFGFGLPGFRNNINMSPNSRIEILSGNELTISQADIYSCNGQWDGINIQSGGKLNIDRSTIQDAVVAIEMHDLSEANLFNNTLSGNDTGIGCFSTTPVNPNLNLIGSAFFSNLITSGNIGIDFNNAGLLHIIGRNVFEDLKIGILLHETDLDIETITFIDCNTAIRNNTHNNCLFVDDCVLSGGSYGIHTAGSHEMVIGPTFNVFFDFNKINIVKQAGQIADHTLITSSGFNSTPTNLAITSLSPFGEIISNDFFSADRNNINLNGLGTNHAWSINANDEMEAAKNSSFGININMTNIHGIRVRDNLDMSSNDQNIRAKGGKLYFIQDNIMTGLTESISIQDGVQSLVACNETSGSQIGLEILGDCSSSIIRSNTLSSSGFNLAYGTAQNGFANTGTQSFQGNLFDLSSISNPKAVNNSAAIIAEQNQYTVSTTSQGSSTYPFFISAFQNWFDSEEGTNASCLGAISPEETSNMIKGAREIAALLNAHIDTIYGSEIALTLKLNLYRNLRILEQGSGIPVDLQSWHTQLSNTAVSQIVAFEEVLTEASLLEEEESLAIDNYRSELAFLIDSLHQWEWFSMDTLTNPDIDSVKYAQYLTIKTAVNQKLAQITSIKEIQHNALIGKLGLLDTLNNNITTSPLASVQNQKTVNSFLLQRLAPSFTSFSTGELSTLETISLQCPSLGGEGVYLARVLWAEANDNFDRVYNDDCLPTTSAGSSLILNNEVEVEKFTPVVSPNPALGYTILSLPKEHNCKQVIIFNAQGQKIRELRIAPDQEQVYLSTKELSKGLYFLHLNNVQYSPIKLMVK